MTVEIKGLKSLDKTLKSLPPRLQTKVVRGATLAGANVVRKEARRRAPVRTPDDKAPKAAKPRLNKGTYVQVTFPGHLRKNIRSARNRRVPRWQISYLVGWTTSAFYGLFIEKGTKHQGAQPFLRPAFDSKKGEINKVIGERIWRGLKRELGKLRK